MKTAVIFYSYEGNSALAAETFKTVLKADVFEIKTADTKKRTGFALILWGGGQVMRKKKPAILPLSVDVNAYDLVILGTPVWAGSPAPAMVSFLSQTKITGKKIALFCCHGGGKGKIFDKLKTLLPENTFAGEIDFLNPARKDRAAMEQKIAEFARSIN